MAVVFFHLNGREIIHEILSNMTCSINMPCRCKIRFRIQKLEWEWRSAIQPLSLYSRERNRILMSLLTFCDKTPLQSLVLKKFNPKGVFPSNLCIKSAFRPCCL